MTLAEKLFNCFFQRIIKGVYRAITSDEEQCILIEGDGRDLSMLKDNSIDCIFTDHLCPDIKSNKGGTHLLYMIVSGIL